MPKSLQYNKMGGAAVENAAKIGAFVVCALCAFVLLSCGGGGGGGGGAAAAGSSGPWGGKTTITIPFTKGVSRAGFSEGFKRLDWESITFTVTQIANGVSEVVFEEMIETEKNITVEVVTGSKIEATAVITMNDGTPERTATGVIEKVEPGKNALTLHVPYTATIVNAGTGQTVPYNSKDGLKLDDVYGVSSQVFLIKNYTDRNTGKTYEPGIHHDITGDMTLDAESLMSFSINDAGNTFTGYTDTGATTVTVPAKVGDYTIANIGYNSLANNTSIQHVTIAEGYSVIEGGAFLSCSNLQSVQIPDSVTAIIDNGFADCTSLERVTMPVITDEANIFWIGEFFPNSYSLTDIYFTTPNPPDSINVGTRNPASITIHLPSGAIKSQWEEKLDSLGFNGIVQP